MSVHWYIWEELHSQAPKPYWLAVYVLICLSESNREECTPCLMFFVLTRYKAVLKIMLLWNTQTSLRRCWGYGPQFGLNKTLFYFYYRLLTDSFHWTVTLHSESDHHKYLQTAKHPLRVILFLVKPNIATVSWSKTTDLIWFFSLFFGLFQHYSQGWELLQYSSWRHEWRVKKKNSRRLTSWVFY